VNAPSPPGTAAVQQGASANPVAGDPLWYKDAIIYQLHVKAFADSNGDGIGDFRGLTQKLDYIAELGVNVVWLQPFYPSPMLDDGYDVADYHNVNPAYGTRQDFKIFVREAHRRGLKVITELIINHTSDQHPWFQAARRAPPGSSKRGYYVWTDDPHKYSGTRIIFTDTEKSNWAWDEVAQAYYWHRFFSHQPDLNFDNPHVLKAVVRVMRFWLDMGVDGFRLDAIPYLIEREGTNNENLPETHVVIKQIRAALDASHQGKVLLAEANQWPEDVRQYFGNGDECHMAYHFPLMPRLFMSIAMEDREPLIDIMGQTPEIPGNCQWAIFLRNHDELTLEMVSDRERAYMYRIFASDPRMRVNVGIRRRLAPLLENSRPQVELISFMLMTMPGSPILYYGDEIGMGDNIYLGDRNGVRTPMQWSPDRNAGFSQADPQRLYLPPIMDALYGYQSVNVESQLRSGSSLLHWTRRLIAVRGNYKAFGRGSLIFLHPGNRKVLAYLREYGDEAVLCVVNLARTPQAVELDLARFEGRVPVEIVGKASFPPIGKLPYLVTLAGHGYFAFRLSADVPAPAWHEQVLPYRTLPVLVLGLDWHVALRNMRTADDLERFATNFTHERMRDEILLPYLRNRRWFALKGQPVADLGFDQLAVWETEAGNWLMGLLYAVPESGPHQRYFFPLGISWEERDHDPLEKLGAWSLAKVRRKDKVGVMFGAFGSRTFARALAHAMGTNSEVPHGRGRLRFSSTSAYSHVDEAIAGEVRVPQLDQTNTGIFLGNRYYLKGYRRLHAGLNPELEIGRFLTEKSPFPHIAPVAGSVEYIDGDGTSVTLAVLQQYVENRGDAWTFTLDHLERVLSQPMTRSAADAEDDSHDFYFAQLATLATRIAQLHHAFAPTTGDPAFDPEETGADEIGAWKDRVAADATDTLDQLEAAREQFHAEARAEVDRLIGAKDALVARIRALSIVAPGLVKTRHHGDLHLGQVLRAQNDFVIIDFEGEPGRPIEERRAKHSPLRDVAGMIRSLNYAAHATLDRIGSVKTDASSTAKALGEWEGRAIEVFLGAYEQAAAGLASIPADRTARRALLRLFEIEKALYELRYELNQRPDWVLLPVRGLLSMAVE
jgi:maltose alpha-D-glucosyltransferase/alpha-amylase